MLNFANTLEVSSVQKYVATLSSMCSELSRQLQAPKSRNPSAMAGVFQFQMVARGGIEPPTQGFSILCSTD